MHIRKLITSYDIAICVDLCISNLSKSSILPVDRNTAIYKLFKAVRLDKPIRLIEDDDGKIIAFIYADTGEFIYTNYQVLVQYFFATNQKGRKAIKVIKLLHAWLVEYATSNKIPLVFSTGNFYDPTNVFSRTLETEGWEREGYLAVYRTGHPFMPPVSPPGLKLAGAHYEGHGG